MTPLTKDVTRVTEVLHRGIQLVVRMSREGIYLKGRRERWSSAMLVPWAAAYDVGAKMKARRDKEEKAARRKDRQKSKRPLR